MTPGDPLLDVRRITRRFGDVTAVDAVDLVVPAGQVVGLIGANGAGKTTLIRLSLGLLHPDEGAARLFDAPPSRQARRRLGYVPQGLGLYRDLTVAENLVFAAAAYGIDVDPRTVLADAEDLAALGDRLIGEVPLGVRRRVAFLAALLHRPDLLVLDEPTSGVDPLGRARLWDTIKTAAEAGAGVLVTTHHLAEAALCDRLVFLAAGRVVASGTPAGILGDATVVSVESERWSAALDALEAAGLTASLSGRSLRVADAAASAVEAALLAAGISATVARVPATLEERFVALAA